MRCKSSEKYIPCQWYHRASYMKRYGFRNIRSLKWKDTIGLFYFNRSGPSYKKGMSLIDLISNYIVKYVVYVILWITHECNKYTGYSIMSNDVLELSCVVHTFTWTGINQLCTGIYVKSWVCTFPQASMLEFAIYKWAKLESICMKL